MPAWSSCLGRLGVGLLLAVGMTPAGHAAPPSQAQAARTEYAKQLWEQGQAAMRVGQVGKAIGYYQQSLAADPGLVRNHLSLSAAYLEKNEPERACVHLGTYLHFHPEHVAVRVHLAELLMRMERLAEAREEFERFAADCPQCDANDRKQLIHCHSRLMEIAETLDDEYAQHLHRGIGLFLLAKQRATGDDDEGELPPEGLLCKAAAELTQARLSRPDQARPSWYLYLVWSKLGRHEPAIRSLREADDAAPFSDLDPVEQRGLAFARRVEQERGLPK